MNLLDLPNELLELIVRFCSISSDVALLLFQNESAENLRFTDLSALSQSCSVLYKITTPILFRIICVTSDEAIAKLQKTLCAKPELAQYPQIVNIEYGDNDSNHMKVGFLADLPNVKHLFIQSPGSEYSDEDEFRVNDSDRLWSKAVATPLLGAVAPLSSLHSCSLSFSNVSGDFWDITQAWQAFVHPTLKCLTLDRTSTHQSSVEDWIRDSHLPYSHSTMLQELHFTQSDVTLDVLEFLIQCPKSLKALTITNNLGYPLIPGHIPYLVEEYINSMKEVAQTLEYFRLHDHQRYTYGPAKGLASFSALRVLDIEPDLLFGGIKLVSTPFAKVIPPNLEILRLGLVTEDIDFCCLLELAKNRSTLAPKLQTYIFRRPRKEGPPDLKKCDDWYRDLQDQGIEIEFEECTEESSFCPKHHGDELLSRWKKSVY